LILQIVLILFVGCALQELPHLKLVFAYILMFASPPSVHATKTKESHRVQLTPNSWPRRAAALRAAGQRFPNAEHAHWRCLGTCSGCITDGQQQCSSPADGVSRCACWRSFKQPLPELCNHCKQRWLANIGCEHKSCE
jgi:hypothetical protein